jgi:hypothetical protein
LCPGPSTTNSGAPAGTSAACAQPPTAPSVVPQTSEPTAGATTSGALDPGAGLATPPPAPTPPATTPSAPGHAGHPQHPAAAAAPQTEPLPAPPVTPAAASLPATPAPAVPDATAVQHDASDVASIAATESVDVAIPGPSSFAFGPVTPQRGLGLLPLLSNSLGWSLGGTIRQASSVDVATRYPDARRSSIKKRSPSPRRLPDKIPQERLPVPSGGQAGAGGFGSTGLGLLLMAALAAAIGLVAPRLLRRLRSQSFDASGYAFALHPERPG